MGYDTSFEILHGNRVSMPVSEGAWTSNADYKEGGYFASPIKVGDFVALEGTTAFLVEKASAEDPIGIVEGQPMGKNEENGRVAAVRMFGEVIIPVVLHSTSGDVAIGDSVELVADNKWKLFLVDAVKTANGTVALEAGKAGDTIYVLFGYYFVAGPPGPEGPPGGN